MLRQRHFPRRFFSLKGRSCGLRHSIAVDRCFASSISSAPCGPAASLAELKATAVASADSTLSTCCGLMSRRHSGVSSLEDGDRLTLALDSSASVVGSIADRLSNTATSVTRLILTSVLLPRPLRPCETRTSNSYSVNENAKHAYTSREGAWRLHRRRTNAMVTRLSCGSLPAPRDPPMVILPGARAMPATKYPSPVASKDRRP